MTDIGLIPPFMCQLAANWATPVLIATTPESVEPRILQSGTATLLRLHSRPVAVTAQHVVEKFRELRGRRLAGLLQVGRTAIDLDRDLLSEDATIDLATIDLSSTDHPAIAAADGYFHEPPVWPPKSVSERDVLFFAGFPGSWRKEAPGRNAELAAFCNGAARVTEVHERGLFTELDLEHRVVKTMHGRKIEDLNLGGMSGGPVFVWRLSEAGVSSWEMAGVIIECYDVVDRIRICPARNIREDATLMRQFLG